MLPQQATSHSRTCRRFPGVADAAEHNSVVLLVKVEDGVDSYPGRISVQVACNDVSGCDFLLIHRVTPVISRCCAHTHERSFEVVEGRGGGGGGRSAIQSACLMVECPRQQGSCKVAALVPPQEGLQGKVHGAAIQGLLSLVSVMSWAAE